jgi:hypothetical protein
MVWGKKEQQLLHLPGRYGLPDFETLEFLGDSVLHLQLTRILMSRFEREGPGELTGRRIQVCGNFEESSSVLRRMASEIMQHDHPSAQICEPASSPLVSGKINQTQTYQTIELNLKPTLRPCGVDKGKGLPAHTSGTCSP